MASSGAHSGHGNGDRCEHCGSPLPQSDLGRRIVKAGYHFRSFAKEFGWTHGQIASWASRNHRPKRPELAKMRFIFPGYLIDDGKRG